jgi:hypothetical protein
MRAVDFDRVMEHSSMRVPRGYGSRAYFSHVDAASPSLTNPVMRFRRVSYITALYPFGFYALEAAWMKLIAVTTGSLVAAFFGARLLCVALMMIGLYFSYRVATAVGVPEWIAVLLLVAIGFLPLTTMVSSYVQPDNLVFSLVPIVLFLSIKVRNEGLRPSIVACFALALGLLSITKYQFFVSTAAASLFLFGMALWRLRLSLARSVFSVVLIVLPTISLQLLQFWVSFAPRNHAPQSMAAPLYASLQAGPAATSDYILRVGFDAFLNYFVTGGSTATYWGVLGWVDTPLVIVNEPTEILLRYGIALATIVTFVVVVFVVSRNLYRLVKLALRSGIGKALAVASRDPMFNSYAAFVVIMFTLYVASDNVFGAEGRHWYPYVLAAGMCFVWYGPKVFYRARTPVAYCAVSVFAIYALFAATYATGDMLARYYGDPGGRYIRTEVKKTAVARDGYVVGVLWPVDCADYHVSEGVPQKVFPVGSHLKVDGAILQQNVRERVSVILDNKEPLPTLSGQYNYLVAERARSIQLGSGGFEALIRTEHLSPGRHIVAAYVESNGKGSTFSRILPVRAFFLYHQPPRGRTADLLDTLGSCGTSMAIGARGKEAQDINSNHAQ